MSPQVDLQEVLQSEVKEWHFHIYFNKKYEPEQQAALELRDAVLRLTHAGAFVAVPSWRVDLEPVGPHPVGSYEIWCPSESFAAVFSYLCMNHGELSILVHPLTKEERKDYELRNAWIGPSFPLDISALPVKSDVVPSQYPSLKLGYSSETCSLSLDARKQLGANVERILRGEKEAARFLNT